MRLAFSTLLAVLLAGPPAWWIASDATEGDLSQQPAYSDCWSPAHGGMAVEPVEPAGERPGGVAGQRRVDLTLADGRHQTAGLSRCLLPLRLPKLHLRI